MVIDPKTPLTLSEIMGSLISSVIEAQAQAARATVDFIEEVGLEEESKEDAPRELRKARFRYSKLNADNQPQDFVVEVPLLGLVDIPMIAVSKATFSFTYDVTNTAPQAKPAAPSAPARGGVMPLGDTATATLAGLKLAKIAEPAIIKGRFTKVARPPAPSGGTGSGGAAPPQESGGLQVTVELEKAPMPVGVERVLEILELAAAEAPVPEEDGGG